MCNDVMYEHEKQRENVRKHWMNIEGILYVAAPQPSTSNFLKHCNVSVPKMELLLLPLV